MCYEENLLNYQWLLTIMTGMESSLDGSSLTLSSKRPDADRYNDHVVPKIHAVATMWHETRNEMTQLLKSIFRMDSDQSARRNAQKYFGIRDPDYYEFEGRYNGHYS